MNKINVALVGVGNCAKALVEGVAFYTKHPDETVGLMNPLIGPYHPKDINFVAAFDVDERKVGRKLHEAVSAEPNMTAKISDPLEYDVVVQRGPTYDSVVDAMREFFIHESRAPVVDITRVLRESEADILVNYLPSGGEQATYAYAEAALEAGCHVLNCIPTPLATIPQWRKRFEDRGLLVMGDDIKSQVGATILNRSLLSLLKMRGVKVTKSVQENVGGNADHFNLLHRYEAKERSKRAALTSILGEGDIKPVVKLSYTGENTGHKLVKIQIEGEIFGRTPIVISAQIEDEISINSAGIVVDAIRALKLLALTRARTEIDNLTAFLMKTPPKPMPDLDAFNAFQDTMERLRALSE